MSHVFRLQFPFSQGSPAASLKVSGPEGPLWAVGSITFAQGRSYKHISEVAKGGQGVF